MATPDSPQPDPPGPGPAPPSAFVIDNTSLRQSSKKPHHVASRLQHRRSIDSHAECGLSTSPSQAQLNHDAFLEARRAKAAERLHHVEQVRAQRLNRTHTQMHDQLTALEEGLRQATEKREQLLRDQAATCAGRVRRAKQVAQLQAIRHHEKAEHQRLAMEARLRSSAERRRRMLRLNRLARSGSSGSDEPEGTSEEGEDSSEGEGGAEAGRRAEGDLDASLNLPAINRPPKKSRAETVEAGTVALQRLWRRRRIAQAYRRFRHQHFTLPDIRTTGPGAAAQAMTSVELIDASTQLIAKVLDSVYLDHPLEETPSHSPGPSHPGSPAAYDGPPAPAPAVLERVRHFKNPGRLFLMGQLLAVFPREILTADGPQDLLVATLATNMANAMAQIGAHYRTAHLALYVTEFIRHWDTFYRTFMAWKRNDSQHILETLIAHFLELDRLWHTVKVHGDSGGSWRTPIAEQRDAIRQQILNFGGQPALDRMHRAQAVARRSYTVPVESPGGTMWTPHTPTEPVSARGNGSAKASSSKDTGRSTTETVVHPDDHAHSDQGGEATSSLDQLVGSAVPPSIASYLANEKLAHEIAVDPYFELGFGGAQEIYGQVQSVSRQAYFDHLHHLFDEVRAHPLDSDSEEPGGGSETSPGGDGSETDPNANPDFAAASPSSRATLVDCLVELFTDYRNLLLAVAPTRGNLRHTIEARLDPTILERQLKDTPDFTQTFDFQGYLTFVIGLISEMCAPVRDPEVARIRAETDPFRCAGAILETLQHMRLDHLNLQIQMVRPFIKRYAVRYEREKFQERLNNKQLALDQTTRWLRSAIRPTGPPSTVQAAASAGAAPPSPAVSRYLLWLYEGVTQLLFATKAIRPESCPETLLLDIDRLFTFQNEIQALTIVSALLMLTKNLALPNVRQQLVGHESGGVMVRQLKDKLLELLRHDDTKVDHLVAEIQRVINGGGSSSDQRHHQGSGGGEATPPSPATTFLGSQPQPPSSAMVRSMVLKTLNYSDPVYNLLSRRLQNLLRTWLLYPGHYAKPAAGDSNGGDNGPSHGAGSSSNSSAPVNPLGIRLRTGLGSVPSSGHGATASNSAATGNPPSVRTGPLGSSADTLLRSYGLEPVEPEMRKLFTRINTLVDYNRLVYGVYYDRIFMELVN